MGVKPSNLYGGYTPICDRCGVCLCWDISEHEYEENITFWENWTCELCDPKYKQKKNNERINDHSSR